jgi:hypothetical protein
MEEVKPELTVLYMLIFNLFRRCHLPSGKIAWLCEEHSKGNRITKLGVGSISVHGQGQSILNKEDELMKEYLKSSPHAAALLGKPEREASTLSFVRQPSLVRSGTNTSLKPETNSQEIPQAEQNGVKESKEAKTETPQKQAEDKGTAKTLLWCHSRYCL